MATIATEGEELLVSLLADIGPFAVIGIVQTAFGRVLDEIERRGRVARLAARPAGSGRIAACGRGARVGGRRACSSVAQAFHANAPMPAIDATAKSEVVSLRTVRFLTLVAVLV
jgi:hypothetical protein